MRVKEIYQKRQIYHFPEIDLFPGGVPQFDQFEDLVNLVSQIHTLSMLSNGSVYVIRLLRVSRR